MEMNAGLIQTLDLTEELMINNATCHVAETIWLTVDQGIETWYMT